MPKEIPVDLTKTGGSLTAALGGAPATPEKPLRPLAAEKASEAPPPAAEPPPPRCKQCGLDPTHDRDHLEPGDEEAFVKAVLRGEPFRREFTLFGGAVRVTFRDVTPDETVEIGEIVDKEEAQGKFPPTLAGAALRFDRAVSLRLGRAVEKLSVGGSVAPAATASYDEVHKWLVGECKSEMVYRGVREAYLRFSNLLAAVGKKAFDPSFSKATAGGG